MTSSFETGMSMSAAEDAAAGTSRRLNHVEFAHRPGESGLVIDFFEALGCSCHQIEAPPFGNYVVVRMDGSPYGENDIFVSEAEPEQLALENAMRGQFEAASSVLAQAQEDFRRLQRERPYRVCHIGIRVPSVVALDAVIERLERLGGRELAGRLDLGHTISRSPEEARRTSSPLKQIWIWTDVISTGLLSVGQQIELQAYGT